MKTKRHKPKKPTPPSDPKALAFAEFFDEDRRETQRFSIISPILEIMGSRWPKLFSMKKETTSFFPFASNIVDALVAELPQFNRAVIRDAVDAIRETEEYLMATSAGGPRYDLDGKTVATVSSFEQAVAAVEYRQLRTKKADRLHRMGAELTDEEKSHLEQRG